MRVNLNTVAMAVAEAMAVLVLAGCGGGGDASGGGQAASGSVNARHEVSAQAGAASAPGVDADARSQADTTAAAAGSLSPACTSFYADKPAFALSTSRAVDPIDARNKPTRGVVFAEPTYKTCAVRATDHAADGAPGYLKNDYSRRQAFNADNTKFLVVAQDGYFHVYDANTRAHLKKLPGFGVDPEPQWHPTHPDLLYIAPSEGSEMSQKELNVSTGAIRVVGDFKARLKTLFPGWTPGQAETGSEGSPSKDGRYWCYMVRDAVKTNEWGSKLGVGVFTWDRDTDTITGAMPLNGEIPDHVSMSPSGEYCVVSSDGATGTTAFSRDFSQKTRLLSNSQHSDLAIDANGRDVYVGVDNRAGPTDGDVFFADLKTGARTLLFNSYIDGTATAFHFSGKAYDKPGWVLVSSDADGCDSCGGPVRKWLHRKIMAVQLKANPVVYNLGFHRSAYVDYDTSSLASVNRDFTRVIYNSNWGVASNDMDAYVIEIPRGVLKDTGTTPTPTPTPTPAPGALAVALDGAVTRSGYKVTYKARTDQPALCGSAWTSGQPYAWLYDHLSPSADGLTHNATVYLDSATAARTLYLVCKANATGKEKELAIQVH